jgi:protein gp37
MDLCALAHRAWHPRVRVSATLTIGRDAMDLPCKWKEAFHVFVMPDSDAFTQSERFLRELFAVMNAAAHHEFQLATRHPERALAMGSALSWTPNIWLGALAEGGHLAEQLEALRRTEAKVKFAHLRPRPGEQLPQVDLDGLSFVIVQAAGEPEGIPVLQQSCEAHGVRLFLGPRVENAPLHGDSESRALVPRGTGWLGRK